MLRSVMALVRVSWLTAASFRFNMLVSVLALAGVAVPLYFVAGALQPMMAGNIRGYGDQYFAFLLVGMATFSFVAPALVAAPTTLTQGISSGTLEAMLSTRTPLLAIVVGGGAYPLLWNGVRFLALLTVGWALGARFAWGLLPVGAGIVALVTVAYFAIGLLEAALYVAWRVRLPLAQGLVLLSGLLGGVYYPTRVIPGWLRSLAEIVPLTHGLRALRRLLLEREPVTAVAGEVGVLLLIAAALTVLGVIALTAAVRVARRVGTLAQS